MKGAKLRVGDMKTFKAKMDELKVTKAEPNYHDPVHALFGLDVFEHISVPKNEAWLVDKNGETLRKFNL